MHFKSREELLNAISTATQNFNKRFPPDRRAQIIEQTGNEINAIVELTNQCPRKILFQILDQLDEKNQADSVELALVMIGVLMKAEEGGGFNT